MKLLRIVVSDLHLGTGVERGKRNAGPLFATLAAIQGENAGLLAALRATGAGQPVDLAAVKAAAKAGSEEALAELQAVATTTVTLTQEGN